MRVMIIGSGTTGQQTLDILFDQNSCEDIAFFDDDPKLWGTVVNGVKVRGGIDLLFQIDTQGLGVVIALADYRVKSKIASRLSPLGLSWISAIHPTAVIMKSAKVGPGNILQAGTFLDTGSRTGNHVLIEAGATVGYNCVIEDYSILAAGTHLAGNNVVGYGAFVGIGASLCPGVCIGEGSVIGAGAAVTQDIPDGVVAVGVPARVIKKIDDNFDRYGRVLAGIERR